MKPTAAISIAALVAALAVTPSLALDLKVGVGANAGVSASSDDNDSSANAGVGLGVNVDANSGDDDSSLDVGVGVDAGVSAEGDDDSSTSVDGTVTGAIGTSTDEGDLNVSARLDALLSVINDADYDEASFSAWSDASATTVIRTNDLFDLDAQSQIDAAVQANLDEQDDLNLAINANASLRAWLDSNDIDAASVIAIDVSADGSVNVYEG